MTKNVLLSGIICCLASGGLLPQRASAMLPVGNDSHRRFYREQEWIWTASEHPATSVVENTRRAQDSTMPTHPSQASLAFTMPTHPPQASLAFTMPTHPPQASLAFTMPTHPPQESSALTIPTHPSQAGLASAVPTDRHKLGWLQFSPLTGSTAREDA